MGREWRMDEGRVNPAHRWVKVNETQDGDYRTAHYECENGCPTRLSCPVNDDPNDGLNGMCFTPFTPGREL